MQNKDKVRRMLSLSIMFFAGTGFRIFEQGGVIIWLIVLFLINYRHISFRNIRFLKVSMICFALFVSFKIKGGEYPSYVIVAFFLAYICLEQYKDAPRNFKEDFSSLMHIYMYYSLISFLVLIVGRGLMMQAIQPWYRTFLFLFWYVENGGIPIFGNYRICGLAWEPGIWQMFMNINLFFALIENRKVKEIIFAILAVVTTYSTSGYFMMAIVLVLYFFYVRKSIRIKYIVIFSMLFVAFSSVIYDNISDKLTGSRATSGMVRFGDTYLGIKMLERSPFFGEDPESTVSSADSYILKARSDVWERGQVTGSSEGYMNSVMVNGLMIFFLDYGLVFGIPLFLCFWKFPLIRESKERHLLILIIIGTLMAEPISRTAFFNFFLLAYFMNFEFNNNHKGDVVSHVSSTNFLDE